MPNTNLPAGVVVSMDAPWPVSKSSEAIQRKRRGPGLDFETDAPRAEVVNDVDEVAQVAPQPVELPDDESIPAARRLECGIESRPRVPPPGSRRSFHTANGTLTFKGENR
jgi:hypothetical protein